MHVNTPKAAIEFALSWIYGDPTVPWAKHRSALRAIASAAESQSQILALSCTDRHAPETRAQVRETRRTLVAMSLYAEIRELGL